MRFYGVCCYSQIHSLKLLEMPRLSGMITPGTVSWPPFSLSSSDCVAAMVAAKFQVIDIILVIEP